MDYDPRTLIDNGKDFYIFDKANENNRSQAKIACGYTVKPEGLDYDRNTYLAGSKNFKLSEITERKVIHFVRAKL